MDIQKVVEIMTEVTRDTENVLISFENNEETQEMAGMIIESLKEKQKRVELLSNARYQITKYDKGSEMGRYLTNFIIALEECEVR